MAKAISDEELQLKKRARRRLVGAIALVLLIVVLLPMFLDSEPRPLNQDIAINIPPIPRPESTLQTPAPVPAVPVQPVTPHVAGLPQAEPATEPAPFVEPKSERTKREPAKSETRPEARQVPKPAQKHEIKTAPASQAASDESFVVQLGAFSNAANARGLQRKLQDNKFKAYTEIIKSTGGDRTRVRVGPYPSQVEADKASAKIKALDLSASVLKM